MKNLAELLADLVAKKGGNQSEIARKLGISPQRLGQYLDERQKPKTDFYMKWKKVYGEDIQQMLMSGEIKETNVSRETIPSTEEVFVNSMVKHADEYRVVLKSTIDGPYRLMLESEIEEMKRMRDREIEKADKIIGMLEKENTELREREKLTPSRSK
jgi:transcriptional regulator with XRE-family HTH domain